MGSIAAGREDVRRMAFRAVACASLLALIALATAPAGRAAGVSAVTGSAANPPAFVPDWDGHSDSTVVQYDVAVRSKVTVLLLDPRGRTAATLDSGLRDAGSHLAWWDGRGADGDVLAPGRYRVRVIARPVAAAAGEPGEAGAGVNVVSGQRDVAIRLQRPAVAISSAQLTRTSVGRRGKLASTSATFDLPTAATVSAAVVGASGTVVRNLQTGRMTAGRHSITWSGTDRRGRVVPDGTYAFLVAASGGGRPTSTIRLPIHVDRTEPTLASAKAVRARATTSQVLIPLTLRIGGGGTLTARSGSRLRRVTIGAGLRRFTMRGSDLGIVPARRAQRRSILLTISDPTGNARSKVVTVLVPAVRAPTPHGAAPAPGRGTPGGSTPGAGTAGLTWPVLDVVTSPFGPRWGRPHQGIDINAGIGTRVAAAGAGTVGFAGVMSGYETGFPPIVGK